MIRASLSHTWTSHDDGAPGTEGCTTVPQSNCRTYKKNPGLGFTESLLKRRTFSYDKKSDVPKIELLF